jgi:hypothetical protein
LAKKSRRTRISAEEQRLREILAGMPEDMLRLVDGLIQRAAFLKVELEDLEADINKNGSTEVYEGKNQPPVTRIRAAAQHYDKMVRAYTTVCKQLSELVTSAGAIKGEGQDGGEQNPFEALVQSRMRRVK